MTTRLIAMSHTPLLGTVPVPGEVERELDEQFELLRAHVRELDPTLVVLFAPDHYNGFFHDVMPPYCVGTAASGVGDFGTATGDLSVPTALAEELVRHLHGAGLDTTFSRAMQIDHGAVQPLELLFGGLDAVPVIPVFVNGVAPPFVPMARIRAIGEEVGRFVAGLDERVLLVASGGLSHDPPVPQWDSASEEVRSFLVDGRDPTPAARAAREERVRTTAEAFSRGTATIQDLAPEWDRAFMTCCREGDPSAFDGYDTESMTRIAGHSSHEVRTWVAAFSALGVAAPHSRVRAEYYRPIPEYIAGFAVMSMGHANDATT